MERITVGVICGCSEECRAADSPVCVECIGVIAAPTICIQSRNIALTISDVVPSEWDVICGAVASGRPMYWSRGARHDPAFSVCGDSPLEISITTGCAVITGLTADWIGPLQKAAQVVRRWYACYLGHQLTEYSDHTCVEGLDPESGAFCCVWWELVAPSAILRMLIHGISDSDIDIIINHSDDTDIARQLAALLRPSFCADIIEFGAPYSTI